VGRPVGAAIFGHYGDRAAWWPRGRNSVCRAACYWRTFLSWHSAYGLAINSLLGAGVYHLRSRSF
jgi:hypothetical protein